MEMNKTEPTITIPMSEYKYLLDCKTRSDIVAERIFYGNYIDNEDILWILDSDLALKMKENSVVRKNRTA